MITKILLLILSAVLLFLLWYLLHGIVFHSRFCRPQNRIAEYFYYRISGFFILGLLTFWIAKHWFGFSELYMGARLSIPAEGKKWILIALVIIPLLMLWACPKKANLWQNPKIRARRWSWALVVFSALSWVVYLFAYEFFFRGFLFFPLLRELGLMPALAVNVVLYVLAHGDQGRPMMIGAAVFSVILSLISWETGNFFTAFIIHVINAFANEWISLFHHPEMEVKGLV